MAKHLRRRDPRWVANAPLPDPGPWPLDDPLTALTGPMGTIHEDRRLFSPGAYTPLRFSGAPSRLILPNRNKSIPSKSRPFLAWPSPHVQFQRPQNVQLCVKRKVRKEIIHAKGIAGSKVRKGKQTVYSKVRCK